MGGIEEKGKVEEEGNVDGVEVEENGTLSG